jgi:hypothetical protein
MTKTAYLVYRPVMDYEESMNPYFICMTQKEADDAVRKMHKFCERLINRLPKNNQELSYEEWSAIDDHQRKILREAKWPFGVDLSDDFRLFSGTNEFCLGCIEVMQLAIRP